MIVPLDGSVVVAFGSVLKSVLFASPLTRPKLCVRLPSASTPSVKFSDVSSPVSVSSGPLMAGVTAAFAVAEWR